MSEINLKGIILSVFVMLLFIFGSFQMIDLESDKCSSRVQFRSGASESVNEYMVIEPEYLKMTRGNLVNGVGSWSYEVVNDGPDVGYDISLARGNDGSIHICYHDDPIDRMAYMKWESGTWERTLLDYNIVKNYGSSIDLDSHGNPGMTYSAIGELIYVSLVGGDFVNQTVDFETGGYVGVYSSLKYDSSNDPHISYQDASPGFFDLMYAYNTADTWYVEIVDDEGTNGKFTSLDLDNNGKPHIAYQKTEGFELRYADKTGAAWDTETIEAGEASYGWHNSIAVDSNGRPHIAYYENTNGILKYARWTGSQWSIEQVDPAEYAGSYPSLVLDDSNNPHICYYSSRWNSDNGRLKYAHKTGQGWTLEFLHNSTAMGKHPSLVLDDDERPVVAYTDAGQDALRLLRWDDEAPSANAGTDIVTLQGVNTDFNGSGSRDNYGISSYDWTFEYNGYMKYLTGKTPYYKFNDVGVYTITLNVTDNAGNWDQVVFNVTVNDNERPYADAGGPYNGPQNEAVYFNGNVSYDNVGIDSYTWTLDYQGAEEELFGIDPYFVFGEAGQYNISLNVTDSAGFWDTDAATVTIWDSENPVAVAGNDRTIDQGEGITFDGLSSTDNTEITGYEWTIFLEGMVVEVFGGATPKYVFNNAGEYVVSLNVSDSTGNWDIDSITVTVLDTTDPTVQGEVPDSVPQGTRVLLNATASSDNVGIVKYKWTFNYNGISMSLNTALAEFTFEIIGLYDIVLKVEDAEGNYDTLHFSLNVTDTMSPAVEITSASPKEVNGSLYVFDASGSSDNMDIVQYIWKFKDRGNDVTLTGDVVEYNFTKGGKYNISLRVLDAAGNENVSFVVISYGKVSQGDDDSSSDDDSSDDDDSVSGDKGSGDDGPNWLLIIILLMLAAIIIGVGIVVAVYMVKKNKEEKDEPDDDRVEGIEEASQPQSPQELYAQLYGSSPPRGPGDYGNEGVVPGHSGPPPAERRSPTAEQAKQKAVQQKAAAEPGTPQQNPNAEKIAPGKPRSPQVPGSSPPRPPKQ